MSGPRDLADLADLHALGLLDPAEAAEFERRLATDQALAAAVGAARDRLLALDLTADTVAPSPALWEGIAAAIVEDEGAAPEGPQTRPADPPAVASPLAAAAGAPPVRATAPRLPPSPGRPDRRVAPRPAPAKPARGERRWRRAALGALAACALLAAGLGWRVAQDRPPLVVAVLLDAGGEPVALVEAFADASARVTPLAALDAPEARVLQVWTKWDETIGPVSLGLLETARAARLRGPDQPRPAESQLYEITLEPAGGSPTGKPTGPIVGKGLAKLPRI